MPGGVEWTKQGKSTAEVFSKYIQVQYLACVYCDLLCVNILLTGRLLIIFTSVHCCHHTALPSYHSHHHCIYQFIIITITVMIVSFLDQYHRHYHCVCYCNEIIMMIIVYSLLLSLYLSLSFIIDCLSFIIYHYYRHHNHHHHYRYQLIIIVIASLLSSVYQSSSSYHHDHYTSHHDNHNHHDHHNHHYTTHRRGAAATPPPPLPQFF